MFNFPVCKNLHTGRNSLDDHNCTLYTQTDGHCIVPPKGPECLKSIPKSKLYFLGYCPPNCPPVGIMSQIYLDSYFITLQYIECSDNMLQLGNNYVWTYDICSRGTMLKNATSNLPNKKRWEYKTTGYMLGSCGIAVSLDWLK